MQLINFAQACAHYSYDYVQCMSTQPYNVSFFSAWTQAIGSIAQKAHYTLLCHQGLMGQNSSMVTPWQM